ncbi:MAG: Ig-like domain-containing protein [Lachnospiraceae bacterium]|nr:Ig-like domain-containing protein [Lachnospiraceae bacterium]
MKKNQLKKLSMAFALVFVLSTLFSANVTSVKAADSEIALMADSVCKTVVEAADKLREKMYELEPKITIQLKFKKSEWKKYSITDINDCWGKIYSIAVEGSEGQYIANTIESYGYYGENLSDINNCTLGFSFEYRITKQQEQEFTKEVKRVLKELSLDNLSDVEKIQKIYNYMTANISYDTKMVNGALAYTGYSALMNKKAVCMGYATLFCRMAAEAGLEVRYMYSSTHAWNLVKIGDLWYNLDATWDAGKTPDCYNYFLVPDNGFLDKDHVRAGDVATDEFKKKYPAATKNYFATPYTSKQLAIAGLREKLEKGSENICLPIRAGITIDFDLAQEIWEAALTGDLKDEVMLNDYYTITSGGSKEIGGIYFIVSYKNGAKVTPAPVQEETEAATTKPQEIVEEEPTLENPTEEIMPTKITTEKEATTTERTTEATTEATTTTTERTTEATTERLTTTEYNYYDYDYGYNYDNDYSSDYNNYDWSSYLSNYYDDYNDTNNYWNDYSSNNSDDYYNTSNNGYNYYSYGGYDDYDSFWNKRSVSRSADFFIVDDYESTSSVKKTTTRAGVKTTVTKNSIINSSGNNTYTVETLKTEKNGTFKSDIEEFEIMNGRDLSFSVKGKISKDSKGNIKSAYAEIYLTAEEKNGKVTATIPGTLVAQIKEFAGDNVQLKVYAKDYSGAIKYTAAVYASNLKNGTTLKPFYTSNNSEDVTMYGNKTFKVAKDGSVTLSLKPLSNVGNSGASGEEFYILLNKADTTAAEKAIRSSIKLTRSSKTITAGKSYTISLSKTVDKDNIKKITYSSSNKSVATVSSKGKVKAVKKGSATIKVVVTLKNNKTKTLNLKVTVK